MINNYIKNAFRNQRKASQIIEYNLNPAGDPLQYSRQTHCQRTLQNLSHMVDLYKKPGAEYANYGGLQSCGSPWVCHVCAIKISEYRKDEIAELIKQVLAAGYYIYMGTFTLPHYAHESCQMVNDRFMAATAKMKNQKPLKGSPCFVPYQQVLKQYDCQGYVTTKEPLYGSNGWHIHSHILYVFKKPINDLVTAREKIWECWLKACDLTFQIADYPDHILKAFYKRSFRLDHLTGDAEKIVSQYMTKAGVVTKEKQLETWRMEHEMTKGHLKKSETVNMTPWGMLERIRETEDKKEAAHLSQKFFEFHLAFKGSSFVRWSPGLRPAYGIQQKTDQEIVDDPETLLNDLYGFFEKPEWKIIVKKRLRGWVRQNSNQPWNDLVQKLNNKIKEKEFA